MALVTIQVNHETHTVDASLEMPLVWVLREILGLTGTKYSCGMGLCGACTVHIDGTAHRSCSLPLLEVVDRDIVTIEGLEMGSDHPVQLAWIEEDVPQCGYCQPGQIMSAAALLAANPNPSDAVIDDAMQAVLCRCGTYQRIRRAIHRAAEIGGGR
jgi:aerobic-type carbon monoxide dehydrogenase small subunit (CoxS/CutS family)